MLPLQSRCCGKGSGDSAPWEAPPSSRSPQLCSENWENQVHVPQELGVGRNLLHDLNIREKRSVGRNSRGEAQVASGLGHSCGKCRSSSRSFESALQCHSPACEWTARVASSQGKPQCDGKETKTRSWGVTGAEKCGRSNPARPPTPKSFIPLGLF